MNSRITYGQPVLDLAATFIDDSRCGLPLEKREQLAHELARDIQSTIDSFIDFDVERAKKSAEPISISPREGT